MAGKRGLVMGVANDRSIAWGIARVLHDHGAELAFSYQGGAFGRRAVPLAEGIGAKIIEEADVEDLKSVERVFEAIRKKWGSLDFVVHALAFSDRNELRGRYADTTRKNF
ncbi:MAG TPA: SDR family oxidoreductase, partial [Methyloceanibacter sp.]|nr:SDR family oxidoreductase [Methyloceanibacter sp.]